MPTSASCLSVRLLRSSPGKTTKVGWCGLGAAEQQPSTRSARTKGCQGFMVRVAVSGCSCPCGDFKETLSNESVTPPLLNRPGRELTQGMGCVCGGRGLGSPNMRSQRKGLHHLPLSLLPTVPLLQSQAGPQTHRKSQTHRGRTGFCKLQGL